jgi:hypothetical protein
MQIQPLRGGFEACVDSSLVVFYVWLLQQSTRNDDVGLLSRAAINDPHFPRNSRKLHVFLLYYASRPELRELVKKAHAEWRGAHQ